MQAEALESRPPALPDTAAPALDYRPPEPGRDPPRLLDRLLKRPGVVAWEVCDGGRQRVRWGLLAWLLVALAGYGALVGSFGGGLQYLVAPVKILGGALLAAALCLPSLFILSCLSGGRLTLTTAGALLLQALTLAAVLLIGFAPVAWIFAQSTRSPLFMAALHWLFWLCAFGLGLGQLRKLLRHHHDRSLPWFGWWAVMLLVVMLQMATVVRPLLGPFDGWPLQERQFFLEHWGGLLKNTTDGK